MFRECQASRLGNKLSEVKMMWTRRNIRKYTKKKYFEVQLVGFCSKFNKLFRKENRSLSKFLAQINKVWMTNCQKKLLINFHSDKFTLCWFLNLICRESSGVNLQDVDNNNSHDPSRHCRSQCRAARTPPTWVLRAIEQIKVTIWIG